MISYLANPDRFLRFEKYASPIAAIITIICLGAGLWLGLFASPPAEDHGHGVRLMYVHVPAAYIAMMAYTALAIASLISFVWRHNLADSAARAFALPGAAFTALALITGSLWGKPAWGTWWQWDGRMTSVLILLFIYIGYIGIWQLVEPRRRAARIAAIFAMVGFVNIPIIKFSVEWWNSLHQPATISNIGAPGLPQEILTPLLVMVIAYTALFAWLSMKFIRSDIARARKRRRADTPQSTIQIEDM